MTSDIKMEFLYGNNPVTEALRSDRRVFELFVAEGSNDKRHDTITKMASEKGVAVRKRKKEELARLCGSDHHQGIVLKVEGFRYQDIEDVLAIWREKQEAGLIVVLDGIQDPHNLGALIRSAACAGAHGVIIPKDRAAGITPVVEKASAGGVATIPICQVVNINQTLTLLKDAGFWVFGADGSADSSLYSQDYTGNVVIVIGSEGEGMRPLVRKQCDFVVSIPLRGGVESLNASVAGGIVLFEVVRQRFLTEKSNFGR